MPTRQEIIANAPGYQVFGPDGIEIMQSWDWVVCVRKAQEFGAGSYVAVMSDSPARVLVYVVPMIRDTPADNLKIGEWTYSLADLEPVQISALGEYRGFDGKREYHFTNGQSEFWDRDEWMRVAATEADLRRGL